MCYTETNTTLVIYEYMLLEVLAALINSVMQFCKYVSSIPLSLPKIVRDLLNQIVLNGSDNLSSSQKLLQTTIQQHLSQLEIIQNEYLNGVSKKLKAIQDTDTNLNASASTV